MELYIQRDGQQFGPYSEQDAQQYLRDGTLLTNDLAWRDGLADWIPLSELLALSFPRSTPPPPAPAAKRLDTAKLFAIAGAVLLFFGAFTPVISAPFVGDVTFLKAGWPSYVVLGLAVASLGVVFAASPKFLWFTGGGTSLVLVLCLANFLYSLHRVKNPTPVNPGDDEDFAELGEAIGNELASAIQLQWGCFILGLGAALILVGAYLSSKSHADAV